MGRLRDKLELSYASKQARFDSWSNLRAECNLWKNYAKLKPDNLIRNRHIITVDNEGKQTEQDMAQDLKLPFNIQVNVTYAKKTFFCQIILTIVLSTQRIPSVLVDACSLVCIAR